MKQLNVAEEVREGLISKEINLIAAIEDWVKEPRAPTPSFTTTPLISQPVFSHTPITDNKILPANS